MSEHLVLLGDSILDNRTYTSPEPETAECLRGMLGSGWTVDLLARDGAMMSEVPYQLERVRGRPDVTVLSVGGNDALGHIGILEEGVDAARPVLSRLADIAEDFGGRYRRVLAATRPRSRRLIACTIYEPPMFDVTTTRLLRVPLTLLNDQIVREAARAGVDVLDLRSVCTSPADFVRQIEPSAQGARRIAAAIETAVRRERSGAAITLFASRP
jgi:hypothetical protein